MTAGEPLARPATLAAAEAAVPSRRSALVFQAKVLSYRTIRGARDLVSGPRRLARGAAPGFTVTLGASRTALWSDPRPAEGAYQAGKVHNLRCAVRRLDGIVVPAGAVFSFWRQVGRASRRRGFVAGRMLQEGCLVPAIGGGLCQLSNALYDAALQADCEIIEQHAHSRAVPGSAAAAGRDATVAWNYVDLRFAPRRAMRIEARLERDALVVRFCGRCGDAVDTAPPLPAPAFDAVAAARSCAACGETACFRHERAPAPAAGRTAFLVDENWPEFRDYVAGARTAGDVLGLPLDGARWRLARYRWDTAGFSRVGTATRQAVARAVAVRRLPMQGAARRTVELKAAERIAARLTRLLTADVTRLCVAQSLLPFLWRDGHLGGREVAVMMTRPPLAELHAVLDAAAAAHPERATLADFRAPDWLVAAEAEALAYADRIVTPHAEIARRFGAKAIALAWRRPVAMAGPSEPRRADRIAFPGPAVARAGAFAVRDAARALGLETVRLGSELEGAGFWDGVRLSRPEPAAWLAGVAAVVQPAVVAGPPRHLLAALAAGVPVIASAACGLPAQNGLALVPPDDPDALIAALIAALRRVPS